MKKRKFWIRSILLIALLGLFYWKKEVFAGEWTYFIADQNFAEMHKAVIATKTQPGRQVDGIKYYRSDIRLHIELEDSCSGMQKIEYAGGSTIFGRLDLTSGSDQDVVVETEQEPVYQYQEDFVLEANANNQNNVRVRAGFVDHAGHEVWIEESYHIDITPPQIFVEYDLNTPSNGNYYDQTRTATVTILERNFDERDVEFQITGTGGAKPSIGAWSHSGTGDRTRHVCKIMFAEEGDYTFTLRFQDLAGNQAEYDRVDVFTIDHTPPELTVTFDNENVRNGHYYAKQRTAQIVVKEHNFEESLIRIGAAGVNGSNAVPEISAWHHEGDIHMVKVVFTKDGEYTLAISGEDLAGHELSGYEQEYFVIDQTPPKLELFNIEDKSANRGVVRPGVRGTDKNYEYGSLKLQLSGYQNGACQVEGNQGKLENGEEFLLKDFSRTEKMDDLYILKASVRDLAGNQEELEISFSVNRFGSVYLFDEATENLAGENGTYYTQEGPDLVIQETNVDLLEFLEITCSLNGELKVLKEGADYEVRQDRSKGGWNQYTYSVSKNNFQEEGVYLLTIYSQDHAENASDNNTKGKKLEFAVDKTPPVILVSGVLDQGQYRADSKEIMLDIRDNINLDHVRVILDGKEMTYNAQELAGRNGQLILSAWTANHWQELNVDAYDAAGNVCYMEPVHFLLVPNIFVQFFMNKSWFCGVLGAVAFVCVTSRVLIFYKRKNAVKIS